VVDHLVVAVAINAGKDPLFSASERVAMIEADVAELPAANRSIEVRAFDNLLINFAHGVGATIIIRGLRAVSDFEYEFQMETMNARLDQGIETVFLTASERQQFVASRLVKEVGRLGGDVSSFVSPSVAAHLAHRFAAEAASAKAGKRSRR
jgi:pantetheine-phosphate adenylyltransferase